MSDFYTSRQHKEEIINALNSKDWDTLESLLINEVTFINPRALASKPMPDYWVRVVHHLRNDTVYAPLIDNDTRMINAPRT